MRGNLIPTTNIPVKITCHNASYRPDNYHGIARELCQAAGVLLWEKGDTNTREFWTDVASEALMRACERSSSRISLVTPGNESVLEFRIRITSTNC